MTCKRDQTKVLVTKLDSSLVASGIFHFCSVLPFICVRDFEQVWTILAGLVSEVSNLELSAKKKEDLDAFLPFHD